MVERVYSGTGLEELQEERKHLETLFADRINFYLVFAAGVLAFLFGENHSKWLARGALFAVIAVSILMLFALWRTFKLVMAVLTEIRARHKDTPCSFYYDATWVPNANGFLLVLPIALTGFFIFALIWSFCGKT